VGLGRIVHESVAIGIANLLLADVAQKLDGDRARRETLEEAGARVEITGLHSLFNLPHVNQVYVMFRARLLDTDFGPGPESLDVRLCREEEIPWHEIAFPVIEHSLRLYFDDRRAGRYRVHSGDIVRLSVEPRVYELRLLSAEV